MSTKHIDSTYVTGRIGDEIGEVLIEAEKGQVSFIREDKKRPAFDRLLVQVSFKQLKLFLDNVRKEASHE